MPLSVGKCMTLYDVLECPIPKDIEITLAWTDSDEILDKLDSMLGSCDTTPRVCGNCKHFSPMNSTCAHSMGEHGYNTACECEEKFESK